MPVVSTSRSSGLKASAPIAPPCPMRVEVMAARDVTSRAAITSTLIGHGGAIGALAFSPDDRLVLTTGIDQTPRRWDPATGLQPATLRGAAAGVSSAACAPGRAG